MSARGGNTNDSKNAANANNHNTNNHSAGNHNTNNHSAGNHNANINNAKRASDAMSENPWIVDVTDGTFESAVIEASRETPVVVDFWASWCQPCLMLKPMLEELAAEFGGKFILAKANTDEVPQRAMEFNVQGIPAVYAVVDGEVVDFFQGALPQAAIRQWIEGVIERGALVQARSFEESAPERAIEIYQAIREKFPNDSAPVIGLARIHVGQGRTEEAAALIDELEERGFLEPEAEKVKSALHLREHVGDLAALRSAAAARPDDLETRLQLGEALAAAGDHRAALESLLEIVRQDKAELGNTARERMVDIFRVQPDDSELTREFRKKLSAALF